MDCYPKASEAMMKEAQERYRQADAAVIAFSWNPPAAHASKEVWDAFLARLKALREERTQAWEAVCAGLDSLS